MTVLPDFVAVAIIAIAGLAVGSFLNVVIHRLPLMMADARPHNFDLFRPRSACPHCGHPLTWAENVPLLSFISLRGRCAHCGAKISMRYPVVEMLVALIAVVVAWRLGVGWTALAAFTFVCACVCIAFIDAEHLVIPDAITIPLIVAGLLINAAGMFAPFSSAALGAVAGFAALWATYWAVRLLVRREAMGFGDFKLFAAIGAWLGWQMLPLTLFVACVAGSVVGLALRESGRIDRGTKLPFAPFLVFGAVVMLVWGDALNRVYRSLAWGG